MSKRTRVICIYSEAQDRLSVTVRSSVNESVINKRKYTRYRNYLRELR